jgi:hypothetical protein
MRLTLIFLALCILGCVNKVEPVYSAKETFEFDSLINHSKEIIYQSESANHKVDSIVKKEIVEVLGQLDNAKAELKSLKSIQKIEKVRIDTVYIETKKNFLGKERTKTTVVSDSTVIIDSLQN